MYFNFWSHETLTTVFEIFSQINLAWLLFGVEEKPTTFRFQTSPLWQFVSTFQVRIFFQILQKAASSCKYHICKNNLHICTKNHKPHLHYLRSYIHFCRRSFQNQISEILNFVQQTILTKLFRHQLLNYYFSYYCSWQILKTSHHHHFNKLINQQANQQQIDQIRKKRDNKNKNKKQPDKENCERRYHFVS